MSDKIQIIVERDYDETDKKTETEVIDQQVKEEVKTEGPADYETAIKATGFGKFNIFLFIISTTSGLSTVFESTTMSYVFPTAQCDLNLTLSHKGMLNAVTYSGMVSTSIIWGFLSDTFGRKKLLVIGFLLDALLCLVAATSQSFPVLAASKFLGGAMDIQFIQFLFISSINGPFSALASYLSELHTAKHRARAQLFIGYAMSLGTVLLPILALQVLPRNIHIEIGHILVLRSWNIFLIICCLPALTSGIAFIFFPESPKFLTAAGRNKEALEIYKNIYRMNTGKEKDTYPIKELVIENGGNKDNHDAPEKSLSQTLMDGLRQIRPIILPPHVFHLFLVITCQHLIMMGTNSVRLWLPQLFQAVVDFEYYNNKTDALCVIIDSFAQSHEKRATDCEVNFDNIDVYINSIIIAVVTVAAFLISGVIINCMSAKRLIHAICFGISAIAVAVSFSINDIMTVSLLAIEIGFGTVATNVILSVVVDLFPTTLRSMAVAITMMFGRLGGATGNIIFPHLLTTGCVPSFIAVGAMLAGCGLMAFFLPKTDQKPLK